METERKIEKWLRAYAKKRRGQAGDSFKLDPATRRILQNEISRSESSSEEDDETMSLWEVLRRNWVFFLGFAACIFILASFLFRTVNEAKNKALLSMSTQSQSAEKMRQIQGSFKDTRAKGEGSVTNSVIAKPPGRQSPATLLSDNAPAPAPVPALSPPPPAPASLDETRVTPEAAPPPATMPAMTANEDSAAAPTPPAGLPEVATANQEPSQTFASAPISRPAAQNSFMNTIAVPSHSSTVLLNFQVTQNGNDIRVVDQDGSVYTGTLRPEELIAGAPPENESALAGTSAQKATAGTSKVESPRQVESDKLTPAQQSTPAVGGAWPSFDGGIGAARSAAPVDASMMPLPPGGAGGSPSGPVYSFRVGGMNRTLKQSVVFTATLIENLEAMKNTQVTFGMTANAAYGAAIAQGLMKSGPTNQTAQLPWSSLRIAGTAVIDQTNHIQINAAPVTPAKGSLPPN